MNDLDVQSIKQQSQQHMQEMVDYDKSYADKLKRDNSNIVNDLSAVLAYFLAKQAGVGVFNEFMQQAPDMADIKRFKQFLNGMPKDVPSDMKKNIKLYKHMATIDRQNMANAMIGLIMVKKTAERRQALNKQLKDDYADEITRMAHILKANVNSKQSQNVVNQPIAGVVWTSRLNKHMNKATRTVQTQLDAQIQGNADVSKFAKQITKPIATFTNENTNLHNSESSRIIGDAQLDAYGQIGIELVELETLPDACNICASIALANPYTPKNAPRLPIHGYCRCEYVPIFKVGS